MLEQKIQNKLEAYSLNDILFKNPIEKKITIEDIKLDVRTLKEEVKTLREEMEKVKKQMKGKEILEEIDSENEEDINIISKVNYHKWHAYITLVVKDFKITLKTLIDTGADHNCVREGLIPTKYFEKTKESLRVANIRIICAPLFKRLRKEKEPWNQEMTDAVKTIKGLVRNLPCLGIPKQGAKLIVETDASDLGYGGILTQKLESKTREQLVRYYSGTWNKAQLNYSTVKKEVLSIVLCLNAFQDDLFNTKFLLKIDCKPAKLILEKDVKILISKQIFARWQALLSNFDFDIEFIKGKDNNLPDYLSREFLQGSRLLNQ